MTAPFEYIPQVAVDYAASPSKGDDTNIRSGKSQCDRRYQDTFFDQHRHPKFSRGRPWNGPREMAANMEEIPRPPDPFCGGDLQQGEHVVNEFGVCDRDATFRSGWTAPWVPVKKYFRFIYDRKMIRLDYQAMLTDETRGLRDYYQGAAKLGAGMNITVEPGKIPHGHITTLLGMPSRMAYIAKAALANDPWLLGFMDEPNPMLAEILGYSPAGLVLPDYQSMYGPPAVITPAQVLATPDANLMAVIEQLQAQVAELTAKKAAQRANGKKGAAKRAANQAAVVAA